MTLEVWDGDVNSEPASTFSLIMYYGFIMPIICIAAFAWIRHGSNKHREVRPENAKEPKQVSQISKKKSYSLGVILTMIGIVWMLLWVVTGGAVPNPVWGLGLAVFGAIIEQGK